MPLLDHLRAAAAPSRRAVLAAALLAATGAAPAQEAYPAKPIRLVLAFGVGGIADVVSRVYMKYLGEELGQSIVIENRPGASGNIAAQFASRAAPDGYTLFIGSVGTQIVNQLLYDKLPYEPAAFVPVSLLTSSPYLMAINKSKGIASLADVVAQARRAPGQLNAGSAGNGTSPHLTVELLKFATGTDIQHIPYKSGAEAVNAAMGGQVDLVADGIPVVAPGVKAGKLQALALLSSTRNPTAPEVPTSAELGFPELQVASWSVLLAPPATPKAIVDTLQAAIARTSARPDVRKHFAELGVDLTATGAAAYQGLLASETARWTQVVKAAGVRLN